MATTPPLRHLLIISFELILGIILFVGYMGLQTRCDPFVSDQPLQTATPPTHPSALNSSPAIWETENQTATASPAGEESQAPIPGDPSPISVTDPPVDLSNDLLIRGIYPDPEDEYFESSCQRQGRKVSVFHLWSGWTWVQTANDPCQDWCHLTNDQNSADVVVFHAPTTGLPAKRHPNQKIAAFGVEPRYDGNPKPWTMADSADISMTYNIDSNVPVFYLERTFWDEVTSVPIPNEEEWNALGNIIWVSSNCVPERTAKMEQLMKLVHIDSRGKCLNNGPKPEGYYVNLPSYYRQYKVVITFEKFTDQDYVTEKFWLLFSGGRWESTLAPRQPFSTPRLRTRSFLRETLPPSKDWLTS